MRNLCSNICFSGILASEHNLCGDWCSPGKRPSWFLHVTYFDTRDSQAAKNASSRDNLIDLFIAIEHFFRRLEFYPVITPTVAIREKIVNTMAKVLSILAIATNEARLGRISKSTSLIFTILN